MVIRLSHDPEVPSSNPGKIGRLVRYRVYLVMICGGGGGGGGWGLGVGGCR